MPELPEVETIRRGLQKVIIGKKITKFESRDAKVVRFESKNIEGMYVSDIERRAKILIFHLSLAVIPAKAGIQKNTILDPRVKPEDDKLDGSRLHSNDKFLLVHLKMTGQLIWEACEGEGEFCLKKIKSPSTALRTTLRVAGGHPSPDWVAKLPNAYTRAIFHFEDESVLFFNDLRRFAYMKLYDIGSVIPDSIGDPQLVDSRLRGNDNKGSGNDNKSARDDNLKTLIPELAKLGPEPFDSRSGQASKEFNIEYLMRRAAKIPNRKIKQFITDQEIISGVGNIYVDEALFYAGILPTRPVKEIQKSEWQKIIRSITKALELGLKYGGSSEDTYVDAFGNQGTMSNHTKVYRKTGQPCEVCDTKVERISLGGRGTHFCPKCQA